MVRGMLSFTCFDTKRRLELLVDGVLVDAGVLEDLFLAFIEFAVEKSGPISNFGGTNLRLVLLMMTQVEPHNFFLLGFDKKTVCIMRSLLSLIAILCLCHLALCKVPKKYDNKEDKSLYVLNINLCDRYGAKCHMITDIAMCARTL